MEMESKSPNLGNEQIDKLLEFGQFPKKYVTQSDWSNCKAEKELQGWLKTFKIGKGLLIHGPVGTGKTMAMCLLAQEIYLETGILPRFVYWSELLAKLAVDSEREWFESIKKASILCIDDFGVGQIAPWVMGKLDWLFEYRNGNIKTTIITTNLAPKSLGEEEDWQRFVDRWREQMSAVSMPGQSMRKK
jgi:DNA replication protein DnaC